MKKTKILGIMLAAVMLLQLLVPVNPAIAAEPSGTELTGDKITVDIELTKHDGGTLPEVIAKDSEVRAFVTFAVNNKDDATDGSYFIVQFPDEILRPNVKQTGLLKNQAGDKDIAHWELDTNGLLTVTFTDAAKEESNVGGGIEFKSWFVASEIGNNNPIKIIFEVPGGQKEVEINFEQPAEIQADITKSGELLNNGRVKWTVTVKPGNRDRTNVKVTDILGPNQTLYAGSVLPVDVAYTATDSGIEFTFTSIPAGQDRVVTFETTPDQAAYDAGSVTNAAGLYIGGQPVKTASGEVPLKIDWISKNGVHDLANKQIHWTIDINKDSRTLTGAYVTDTLPAGLTLVESSVKLYDATGNNEITTTPGSLTVTTTATGQAFTYTLGSISEPYKLKFTTNVDPDAYKTNGAKNYTNKAWLWWDGQSGSAPEGNDTVGVGTHIISKTGTGYNPANHEITWKITVNANKISINNAVVTDYIPEGQEYVDGSFSITPAAIGGSADTSGTATPVEYKGKNFQGKLVYTFSGTITDTYVITFKTRVTDPEVYGENKKQAYKNWATLGGDGLVTQETEGSQQVESTVLGKAGVGYDYANRVINWKITVNQNKMEMKDAVVRDYIPAGQEYEVGSFKVFKGTGTSDNSALSTGGALVFDPEDGVYETKSVSGKLTYSFGTTITDTYTIIFQTKVTDLSVFEENDTKTFNNYAELTHKVDGQEIKQSVTGSQTANNTVVGKDGIYTSGNAYIDWVVTVNSNALDFAALYQLEDAVVKLVDTLPEGLELDTDSVGLYPMVLNTNGTLTTGTAIDLTPAPGKASYVSYDYESREFIFTFPEQVTGPYRLKFRTYVTDLSKSSFTNTILLQGQGQGQSDGGTVSGVRYVSGGGYAYGETGSVTLEKVEKFTGDPIQGVVFKLEGGADRYGNARVQELTTDADGKVVFDRLKFDREYTITEESAPESYTILWEGRAFEIDGEGTAAEKHQTWTVENINKSHVGDISFSKKTEDNRPLGGAVFTLYSGDTAIKTAVSSSEGVVTFEDLMPGEYTIRETTAPPGYYRSDREIKATVAFNGSGEIVTTVTPDSVVNTRIPEAKPYGTIMVRKTDDKGALLSGAVFTLYGSDGSIVQTAAAGSDGTVIFSYVALGFYTIRETKAPAGYVSDGKDINVTLGSATTLTYTVVNKKEDAAGRVEVLKTDNKGGVLAGAEFTLTGSGGAPVLRATSGTDGRAVFEGVPAGSYTLAESRAPQGYVLKTEPVNVSVGSGETKTYTFINEKTEDKEEPTKPTEPANNAGIEIKKLDGSDRPLAGATFTLFDSSGNALGTAVSGADGYARFTGLAPGSYSVRETAAPTGYVLMPDSLKVTLAGAQILKRSFRNLLEGMEDEEVPQGWVPIEDPEIPQGPGQLPSTGGTLYPLALPFIGISMVLFGYRQLLADRRRRKNS